MLEEYAEAKVQAVGLNPVELYEARLAIRAEYKDTANKKVERMFGGHYSPLRWMEAKQEQKHLTQEATEKYATHQLYKHRKTEKQQ